MVSVLLLGLLYGNPALELVVLFGLVRISAFVNNKIISLTIRFILLFIAWTLILVFSRTPSIEYVRTASAEEWTVDSAISALSYKYNVDEDAVRAIIKCESNFKANAVNINNDRSLDYGYWQINTYWHLASAKKLKLDLFNPQDNLEYGFILLKEKGYQPWSASRACHKLVK